jgi:hypothetical protein
MPAASIRSVGELPQDAAEGTLQGPGRAKDGARTVASMSVMAFQLSLCRSTAEAQQTADNRHHHGSEPMR